MYNGKGYGMPRMIGLQEPGKFAGRYDQFEQWKDRLVKWIASVDPRHEDLVGVTIDNDHDFDDQELMRDASFWVGPIWGPNNTQELLVARSNEMLRLSRSMMIVIPNLVEGTAEIMLNNLNLECGYQALRKLRLGFAPHKNRSKAQVAKQVTSWRFDPMNLEESIVNWEILLNRYHTEIGEEFDPVLKTVTLYNGWPRDLKEDIDLSGDEGMMTD